MKKSTLIAGIGLVLAAGAASYGGAALAASGDPLVYTCPDTQGHDSQCANAQEFEVFDKNGAPIFSVGETGGAAVFGDKLSVYPPSSVFSPAVVSSYQAPSGSCTSPAAWIAPQGIWACKGGVWVKKIGL